MPELPEVETIVRELNHAKLVGSKIVNAEICWSKTVDKLSPTAFKEAIQGQSIRSISRRAKFIVFELSNLYMLIHLRMTGKLLLSEASLPHSPYERARFDLSNKKELRFIDTRKFGRIYLSKNFDQFFEKHGPEPLEKSFTWQKFQKMLEHRSNQIKALLLNQSFLAGLGNIYVDEALWLAKLHPLRKANSLSPNEVKALFHAIQEALNLGLKSNGATLGSGKTNFYRLDGSKGSHIYELNVFHQTGKPCKRCGSLIQRVQVAGRSSHICQNCQR